MMVFVVTPVPLMVVQPVVVAIWKNEVDSGRIQLTTFTMSGFGCSINIQIEYSLWVNRGILLIHC